MGAFGNKCHYGSHWTHLRDGITWIARAWQLHMQNSCTLVGAWKASHKLTILATIGLVAATVYSLRIMQKVFQGAESHQEHPLHGPDFARKANTIGLWWYPLYC
jgi:NADH:ubiquinone oxidoreductase subunit 5 (subunit L)/multisubunit Na+/H+ antiporter MnhA subunit